MSKILFATSCRFTGCKTLGEKIQTPMASPEKRKTSERRVEKRKESFAIMQAEEAQLLSTKITGYVINETAVFGFCLDWRSWGHPYTRRRRTTTLRMGITCVIECFRVLAYYRCHDEINNTWADFFCFVRLSPLLLSLRCWAITNCTSSGCRVPPQRLQVGGWCVGERRKRTDRRTCHWNQQSQVHLIVYLEEATSTKAPTADAWVNCSSRILPVRNPSTA